MYDNGKTVSVLMIAGFLFLCVIVGLISLALTTAFVALVWNVLGLRELFNAGTLSFWQCVGVAFIIDFLFGGPTVKVTR